jgi:hypothetical protein
MKRPSQTLVKQTVEQVLGKILDAADYTDTNPEWLLVAVTKRLTRTHLVSIIKGEKE